MSSHVQDAAPTPDHSADMTPGVRLRQAREAAGLSVTEAAEQLRLRTALVEAMERDDLAALGAPVFARGYFSSYARLMDLPADIADELYPREEVVAAAPLRSSNRISHGRFLLDRYARRLVYVALTASIVVPVILLATRDHLPDPAALLAPLDDPMALDGGIAGLPLDADGQLPRRSEPVGPPAPSEQPVMASLTPFYPSSRSAAPAAPVVAATDEQGLVLAVTGESWVEVVDHDGNRLVHELMRSGDRRELDPARVARVLLGNAAAVQVYLDGAEADISAYRRANVARFTVSSDGSLAPAGG